MAVVAGFDPLVVQFTTAAMPRIAVCALSAGDQHMLNTVSGFGTRRRLVPVLWSGGGGRIWTALSQITPNDTQHCQFQNFKADTKGPTFPPAAV